MQLPRLLRGSGEEVRLRFTVGDDLQSAREAGTLKSTVLKVHLEGTEHLGDRLRFQLNQRSLKGQGEAGTLAFTDPPLQPGQNELSISSRRKHGPMVIQGVEVFVDYK